MMLFKSSHSDRNQHLGLGVAKISKERVVERREMAFTTRITKQRKHVGVRIAES